jgi:hypothetical protein
MGELSSGSQVHHASLGIGKVVAAEAEAIHVFFPASHTRFATKLRLPAAHRFLRANGFEPDSWLAGLSAFEYDERAGRWGLTASWLTQAEAIELYMERKPQGFNGPAAGEGRQGAPDRKARWVAAGKLWNAHLGDGEGEKLLADGGFSTVVKRILTIEKAVAPLLGPADQDAFAAALDDEEAATPFLRALFPAVVAAAPGRTRLEALFRTVRTLPGPPAQRWLVATLLPFVASPDRHVLLRPRATGQAVERLGSALGAVENPAWPAYAALRELSVRLLEALAPHGAKDFADVECFLHVTASSKAAAKAAGTPIRRAPASASARSRS